MTKEEQLRMEVEALRAELSATQIRAVNLDRELGKVRAELDNVQANRSSPTALEVMTDDGFAKLALRFPLGLKKSEAGLQPGETAISLIWSLVRHVDRVEAERDNAITEVQAAHQLAADARADGRAVQRRCDLMAAALAVYAIRGAGYPDAVGGEE